MGAATGKTVRVYEQTRGTEEVVCHKGILLLSVRGVTEGRVAELEKMRNEPTIFGPRTFTSEIHHQNSAELQIIEITNGTPAWIDTWTISEPVPLDVLLK